MSQGMKGIFVNFLEITDWLKEHNLHWWKIVIYEGKDVFLLFNKDNAYGFAIEKSDEKQVYGYEIISEVQNLPNPETSTDEKLKNVLILTNEDLYTKIGKLLASMVLG